MKLLGMSLAGFAAWIALDGGCPACSADTRWDRDSIQVRRTVERFLDAFENLDREPFHNSFADGATAFFPTPEPPQLHIGREAIGARFDSVFREIRQGSPGGPPFHRLIPVDLRVESLGAEAALVTFELRNAQRLGRRTLVLRRSGGSWRIVHLHASNVPRDEP